MSRAYASLSNFDFSSDDFSSSEEDEKVKRKLMTSPVFASWANLREIFLTPTPM
jgi:hypothetical protein